MPLPKTPKVKVPPLGGVAPNVMTRSSITDLANRVRQSEGQYGAQRVERAADEIPNLEKLYQDQALMRAFTGDNARALMTLKPSDFERFAAPLGSGLSDRSLQNIANLQTIQNSGGFSDVPFFMVNKEKQGSTGVPWVTAHEGRHRNRAMDAAGEQAGLVQFLPRAELREPFPRRSQEQYIEAIKREMDLSGNRIKPEKYYLDDSDDKPIQRRAIDLPDLYAQGGIVDSAPEEAIKNTIKDPQAFRMLDMDLANLALMNQQPQRMAGGGKLRVMHGSTTKITPDVARSFDVTSDPAYALKRAGDKMDAMNIQGPPVLNKFDVPEDKLLRMDETPYSAEQVNAMRKFWSKLPADTNMTGEQIYDLMTQNRQHYDTLMPGITKAADFAGYQRPATGTGGRDDWFRITNPEHIEMVKRKGGAVHKAEGGRVNIESGIDINREYNPFSVLEKPTYGSDVPSTTPSIDQQRYELTMKGRQEAENRRYRAQQGDALAGVDPTGTLAVADALSTVGKSIAAFPAYVAGNAFDWLRTGKMAGTQERGKAIDEWIAPKTQEGGELLQTIGEAGPAITGSSMGFGMHPNLWAHNPPTLAQMRAGLKLGAERAAPVLGKIDQAVRSGYESGLIPQPGLSIKDFTPKALAPANEQGFYSPTEAAALNLQRKAGNGQAFLNDLLKQENVRPDEIKAMGLDTFLKGRTSVTAAEVQDYIAQNKLGLGESVYGGNQPTLNEWLASKGHRLVDAGMSKKEIDLIDQYRKEFPDRKETKFDQYALPGGENYREVVLTLPDNKRVPTFEEWHEKTHIRPLSELEKQPTLLKMARERYEKEKNNMPKEGNYQSSHFDEPNVLAHLRMSDRVTDGKKTLLVDEVQSDWHQAGREQGYVDPNKKPYTVEVDQNGIYRIRDTQNKLFEPYVDGDRMSGFMTQEAADNAMKNNMTRLPKQSGVPDAPYKDDWYQLALRRAVKEAIDGGYDRVALPTGDRVNERFSLTKYIDRIAHKKNADGTYSLAAVDKEGRTALNDKSVPQDKLAGIVGKEVAQKIIDAEGKGYPKGSVSEDMLILSGLDLKVGGEGNRKYYDEIYPGYLKKFGKKYGATVGSTTVDANGVAEPLHYMDITPAMRKEFSTGIHMKKGGKVSFADSLDAMRHELTKAK